MGTIGITGTFTGSHAKEGCMEHITCEEIIESGMLSNG